MVVVIPLRQIPSMPKMDGVSCADTVGIDLTASRNAFRMVVSEILYSFSMSTKGVEMAFWPISLRRRFVMRPLPSTDFKGSANILTALTASVIPAFEYESNTLALVIQVTNRLGACLYNA